MPLIFHITTHEAWKEALEVGAYHGDILTTEGFIHCSTAQQVVRVANALFRGRADLVLLCIRTDRLNPELHYDPAETGELFPHIYGPLNVEAVVDVVDFPPEPDGRFVLPGRIPRDS